MYPRYPDITDAAHSPADPGRTRALRAEHLCNTRHRRPAHRNRAGTVPERDQHTIADQKIFDRLLKLIADHSPDRIVLLGDVKHTCPVHIGAGASANSRSFSRAYPEICQWTSLPATMAAASGNIWARMPRFTRQQVSCSMVSGMCTDLHGQTRRCSKRNT